MVTADEPGLVTPHAAARNTEAEASQIVRERTNGSMKFREHSELRGPWCAQIVRRQIAYVGSDQLRHGLLAGEPVPDFTLPHSKLLSESHFPPGDAP